MGREEPFALDPVFCSILHPGIEMWLEPFRQSITVDILAKTEPLRPDRIRRLIESATADEILLLEVTDPESDQLLLAPPRAHRQSESTSLLVLALLP